MSVPTRPALRFHGGKWRLAPWIIEHFPQHRVYVEPFGGAASVLLRKPRSYAEVYNEINGGVVNVFKVLRDPQKALELEKLIRLTPFSREEFELCRQSLEGLDELEQARRMIFRSFAGFGSGAVNQKHSTGFRANSNKTTPAHDWAHYPKIIKAFTERLQGVVIENRPAADVMLAHDGKDTLHYVDPPYVHGTRYTGDSSCVYRYEMTDEQHVELAHTLRNLNGMVVLSGYRCDLYDDLYYDWRRVERATHADGSRDRIECLWLSPNVNIQPSLFGSTQ